jgi:peptidoglycan/LPS O-acetylase OafA/YrhL
MNDSSKSRIPSLDGFRAISILLVVVSHLILTKGFPFPLTIDDKVHIGYLGTLGVRIFFVISGFLITSLLVKELDETQRIDLPRFYFRRSMRIFIPYYFFILVLLILQAWKLINLDPLDYLHGFTYTINYFPERSWIIGHAWSLSVEEQFYLLWPGVIFLIGKKRSIWFVLGAIAIVPLIRLGYYYLQPELVKYELGYRFETTADALATGCLLSLLYTHIRKNRIYQWVISSRLFFLVPLVVLYAADMHPGFKRYLLFSIPVQNFGIALCISWGITQYSGIVGRLLNSKALVFLGVRSYSLYLWQQLFLNPHSEWVIARFPLNIILAFACAFIAYFLIEQPSLRLRSRMEAILFQKRTKQEKPVPL